MKRWLDMFNTIKQRPKLAWCLQTGYYLLILLVLLWMYGFQSRPSEEFIYANF